MPISRQPDFMRKISEAWLLKQGFVLKISIVIPIYNEEENIPLLFEALAAELSQLDHDYEVILIDDGSKDQSQKEMHKLSQKHPFVKSIFLRRNYGQTAAITAGINYATGDVIIPMDGDLQNDPQDISRLLNKLEEGYDVVSGWRKDRKDNPIKRNLPSKLANGLISWVSGVKLNDYGCTLKAYRSDVIKDVKLYGEMHRFIPIYATWQGAKVTELAVSHHERKHGVSKYGIERVVKVILDLMVVKFMDRYFQRPIYVFGSFGFINFIVAFVCAAAAIYFKIWGGKNFIRTPLPLMTVLFFSTGVLSIFTGLLAEVLMRTYYESQGKTTYQVRHALNCDGRPSKEPVTVG